ncbi:prolyl oligopeptidase [Crepidotus variabilis]|uniref:Prolyl endopeptidase n=1 Tax=Crepidotus variabilis TaxID=179855 RepID=A0A9P6JMM6_9AGAR|nr:prolyl oligopeptidase [Crepidotus variabilis]
MPQTPWSTGEYPQARRSSHVDIYKSASRGEVSVADPYQWLENDTEETDKWTTAQEAFTRKYLDKNPDLDRLRNVFRDCVDYPKFSAPHLYDDGRWYWFYNSGLDPQTALYRTHDNTLPDFTKMKDTDGELFFDPNALSSDGTASLATYRMSECGKYFAYGISYSGSDFVTIYVRHTSSPFTKGTDPKNDSGRLADEIKFVKFSSVAWSPDSSGFFYQRYPDNTTAKANGTIATDGDVNAMVYYHKLGSTQADDILIFQDKEHPEWMYGIDLTEDGKYLLLYTSKDTSRRNKLWIAEYDPKNIGPNIKWNKVVDNYDGEYDVVSNQGSLFYLRTNNSAPRYKVVTVDIAKGNEFQELIPESDANLSSILCVNKDHFALTYKRNVRDEIYLYSNSGKVITRIAEEFVGAAYATGREKQPWFFVVMSGFTSPGTVGRYDFTAPVEKRWSIYRTTQLNGLNPSDFEAQQVWYPSKDGTKVPMFIVRHKSTKFDGKAPALQYGYGGFSISIDPFFSATILTFLQGYGAILAVPNIRGGGEFGEEWHVDGIKEKKHNGFDDFIAATEYLVKNKYAAPNKVTINGGSNGGLLVAACVNRAPEGTFGCAIAEVGVHDLLKFHKFTIGKAWTSDYGNPDDPKDFDFIYPISPLHNLPTDRTLPPYLLLTADHDDRVVPLHSFKLAATLQHTLPHNLNPLLLRVEKKAGHGAGKSTQAKILENADKYGFVAQALGLVWKDEKLASNPHL